jgi:ABC-type transport system involved in cytochrome bd biosynthesis fused ATPase/permease subunit
MWTLTAARVTPLPPFSSLPSFAGVFVVNNLGPYARAFWWLTVASVVSTVLGYGQVLVLADVVSNVATRSVDDILGHSLPLYLALVAGTQLLDALTRRYAEALPSLYGGWFSQRALRTMLLVDHRQAANLARERIGTLLGTWQAHVEAFLSQWFWSTSRRLVELVFVFVTLWQQDSRVFVAGLVGIALFLGLSLRLSTRMAPLSREQTTTTVASRVIEQNLLLQLPLLQRLHVDGFVADVVGRFFSARVASMKKVRAFHAKRWLLQLGLFYALYAAALFFCIVQIKSGVVAVGFIVTLRYAFDRLFMALVFVVEQYVDLLQQRADAGLLREELGALKLVDGATTTTPATRWQTLELTGARVTFRPRGLPGDVVIDVPRFSLTRGDHTGILGQSGSGKTTILLQLLGLVPSNGTLRVDGVVVDALPVGRTAYINSTDPLLKLSLRDNIVLGRAVDDEHLRRVLDGVCASEWVGDLDQVVGSEHFHLSAGQEQRLRLARGLVDCDVDLYLLDEPFSGLDATTRDRVLAFLRGFLREKTVVLVTHHDDDLRLVDAVHTLQGGVLSARGPVPAASPSSASSASSSSASSSS